MPDLLNISTLQQVFFSNVNNQKLQHTRHTNICTHIKTEFVILTQKLNRYSKFLVSPDIYCIMYNCFV